MIRPRPADDPDAGTAVPDHAPPGGVITRVAAELSSAVTMLTRFPVADGRARGTGARAFGIVGALVGFAGLVPLVVLGAALPPVAAILAVGAMAVVSGAIHLDGLADTADALVAVGPDAAERARKDPAIGVGGATALILVLGIEMATLTLLATAPGPLFAGLACVVAGVASRSVPVVLAYLGRMHAGANGLGAWFVARITGVDVVIVLSIALFLTATSAIAINAPSLVAAGLAGGLVGVASGLILSRARGVLDGDLLGAGVELGFAATIVVAAALTGGTSMTP